MLERTEKKKKKSLYSLLPTMVSLCSTSFCAVVCSKVSGGKIKSAVTVLQPTVSRWWSSNKGESGESGVYGYFGNCEDWTELWCPLA